MNKEEVVDKLIKEYESGTKSFKKFKLHIYYFMSSHYIDSIEHGDYFIETTDEGIKIWKEGVKVKQ